MNRWQVRWRVLAVLSSDASVDSRFSGAHSIIMQGIRSTMAVPLLYGSELFGLMVLDSQMAANAFQEKDLQLFQNVANQAAVAIQNSARPAIAIGLNRNSRANQRSATLEGCCARISARLFCWMPVAAWA